MERIGDIVVSIGHGIEANAETALKWYKQAANAGKTEALSVRRLASPAWAGGPGINHSDRFGSCRSRSLCRASRHVWSGINYGRGNPGRQPECLVRQRPGLIRHQPQSGGKSRHGTDWTVGLWQVDVYSLPKPYARDHSRGASSCFSLGMLYGDAGAPEKSVYYYLKALNIREEQEKLVDAGYICCNLAGFYFQSSYRDQGFKYYGRALGLFRQSKFPKGESYVYNILGQISYDSKDYPAALKYFRKSLALNYLDTLTVRSGFSFNLTNIGDTWLKLKRFDSAQFLLFPGFEFFIRGWPGLPPYGLYLPFSGGYEYSVKKLQECHRIP